MGRLPYKNVQQWPGRYGSTSTSPSSMKNLHKVYGELDEKSNAVINSLKESLQVEKYEMGALFLRTRMMERDPGNHTRWKHKWRWHNRGNVWDQISTEWAGEEDLMRARKRKSTLEEKYQSATFVLGSMKLSMSTERKRDEGIGKKIKHKIPRNL